MGGAEKQAAYLAQFLKNTKEFDVIVWSFFDGDTIKKILINHDIKYLIMPPKTGVNILLRLWNLFYIILKLRKLKPYVLMPFTDYPNKISGLIWKFTGAKSCIWNQRDEGKEITGKMIEILAIKKTPVFISNSLTGKNFLINKYGITSGKITVINNGISSKINYKDSFLWRSRLGIDKKRFVVTMVANIQPYKDHITLIKAWGFLVNILMKDLPKPILLLVGRADSSSELIEQEINKFGLTNSVMLTGEIEDVFGILNVSDLCVFSSKSEGCPNSVLEYMVAKKAIVATNIMGIKEILGEDYPFLVSPNNYKVFARSIFKLYGDKEMIGKLEIRNFNRVQNDFSLEKMNNEYYKFLRQIQ